MKKFPIFLAAIICCIFGLRAQKVFMLGDSHVAGKYYPRAVDSVLKVHMPDMEFRFFGINGASFASYNKVPEALDERLSEFQPDVVVVHLGTNDSYAQTFHRAEFTNNMRTFYNRVHDSLPEAKMVFVTPFYNKLRHRTGKKKKRRRRYTYTWTLNENTRYCSDAIVDFSAKHPGTFVVDNNAHHGMIFINFGFIRPDNVHLTAEGYRELGCQVAEDMLSIKGLFHE